jgi:activator of HSP90 ATPase
MTSKIYKSAQGKTVDLGTIMLRNEHVRAVGNMGVNARGDLLDSENQVIESKPRQIQRQNSRVTTNVSTDAVHTSSVKARRANKKTTEDQTSTVTDTSDTPVVDATPVQEETPVIVAAPPAQKISIPEGGLAAAIARTREVKQELEKTRRQQMQSQGLKKI